MSILEQIYQRARSAPKRIVLPEGEDARIREAAIKAANDGIAKITLLGVPEELKSVTQAQVKSGGLKIIEQLPGNGSKTASALEFANKMVKKGEADGSVAGAMTDTRRVIRSAYKNIGPAQKDETISSFFLMIMPNDHPQVQGGVVFSDCALVVDPDENELAGIASAAADNAAALLGLEPHVAMLSFSTQGSSNHAKAAKVRAATEILMRDRPDLPVDGEIQFDAAMMPEIAARKLTSSNTAGEANVFIFPDLNAGNIGYKIAERLGGAKAIGPIIQGLAKPANDLSRGCSADDIYNIIAVTVIQA